MGLKDLKPFDGLSVLTSEMDEIEVGHLLGDGLGLLCQDCGSKRFKTVGFIPVDLELLSGKNTVITYIDYKEVVVNRVVCCVHCNSTDFVTITNTNREKDNGQE
jgi:hypothetical protein